MKNTVSLKQIADICEVSVATVSRVINENGRYSGETAERVRKAIDEYGYRPNQIAKGLRTNRLNVIAVIVPDITNEFFAIIVRSLQKELFRFGYSLMIFNADESETMEKQCINSVNSLNISAVVSVNNRWNLHSSISPQIPVIYVDRKPEMDSTKKNTVFIMSNHENGGYLAGQELAHCGCKRVACITALADAPVTAMRSAGFQRACRDYQLELSPEFVFVPEEVSMEAGYNIVDQALCEGKVFDGIFCQADWLAIGALSALLDHHIDVPEKVQLVGFDDIRTARVTQRPLTTVHQFSDEIGVRAAKIILDYISRGSVERQEILVPVELKRRGTTCKRQL